jgi:uncharacterized protein (TIGR02466 family)
MTDNESRTANWIFGLPFVSVIWPEVESLNRSLSELILALEKDTPTAQLSNRGGWQSLPRIHEWKHPAVADLLSRLNLGVRALMRQLGGNGYCDGPEYPWSLSLWANVNRRGNHNIPHHHNDSGRCFWSGVYYVSVGAANADEGCIVFRNPSSCGQMAKLTRAPEFVRQHFRSELVLKPVAGLMILFPSWIEHWVTAHNSDEPRISIAFNVCLRVETTACDSRQPAAVSGAATQWADGGGRTKAREDLAPRR